MKQKLFLRVALIALGILPLTAASEGERPVNSGNESKFHCQYCNMQSENSHRFNNVDCTGSGNSCKDCHVFNACHLDTQSGTCDGSHNPCAATFAAALQNVKAILEDSDAEKLAQIISENAKVVWDDSRGVVQVLSCKGGVAYQEQLPDDLRNRLKVLQSVASIDQ